MDKIFTEDGLWIQIEDDFAFLGLNEEACEALGDLLSIELPEEGDELVSDEVFCTISGTEDEIDLHIPFDCLVIDLNYDIMDNPESLSGFCMDNWLVSVKIFDCSQLGHFEDFNDEECVEDYYLVEDSEDM